MRISINNTPFDADKFGPFYIGGTAQIDGLWKTPVLVAIVTNEDVFLKDRIELVGQRDIIITATGRDWDIQDSDEGKLLKYHSRKTELEHDIKQGTKYHILAVFDNPKTF
jgi:hypothetical protein